MRRILILTIILSNIGFSQDCENSILDEVAQNENVNQYFQLALSLNIADLSFLNDCDSDETYTMFVPGINVPTSSAATLLSLDGDLIDYINYYITTDLPDGYIGDTGDIETVYGEWFESIDFSSPSGGCIEEFNYTLNMLDGNTSTLTGGYDTCSDDILPLSINNANISGGNWVLQPWEDYYNPICTCNGYIYIIDDLIWAPGVVSLEENKNTLVLCPNPAKSVLNVSKIAEKGNLTILNTHGQIVFSQEVTKSVQINTSTYQSGMYIVNFRSENRNLTKSILIN